MTTQAMNADELARYVEASAAAIGLPLAAEHRPGVLRYFELAATMAAVVEGVTLEARDESALRFEPVVPTQAPS
ncbi:MAG: DUF4089 domain-containing protein [Burkholderiaceae bacterium]